MMNATQALEDEAVRRTYDGVEKPVTVAGQRELGPTPSTNQHSRLMALLPRGYRQFG
jgi:hypothetical protein